MYCKQGAARQKDKEERQVFGHFEKAMANVCICIVNILLIIKKKGPGKCSKIGYLGV